MAIAGNAPRALSEDAFAAWVDTLSADPAGGRQLIDLLREQHSVYDGRGTAAVVRMRGWILLALGRAGLSDEALIFILEELDTGIDPYLVAAAARALRSCSQPNEILVPFVLRALSRIRYRDQPVSFASYGEYATASADTTALSELGATLAWLGAHARRALGELERLRAERGLPRKLRLDLDRALAAIRAAKDVPSCCGDLPEGGHAASRTASARRRSKAIDAIVLQDQDGQSTSFGEFFCGRPSIVVFFYTRCDNPLKCSLTVAKLARVQGLLEARGLAQAIRTAAITYDPAFDRPERLRIYGKERAVRMDDNHRLLRAVEDNDALREHFELGVNFTRSLVNRHRIELYILDAGGRIAASFARIHWDEQKVVARAAAMLEEWAGTRTGERVGG